MAKLVISHSELDSYRQCPHKWDLSYKQRWSIPAVEGGPLNRGSLWHEVMQHHYLRDFNWLKSFVFNDDRADDSDLALVQWIYEGYLEHWADDPEWRILAVEHTAEVPLPALLHGSASNRLPKHVGAPSSRYNLKIKVDLVIKWRGKVWLVDHKSGKDLPKQKDLQFDEQFPLYVWGLRKLGQNVAGAIYNAARTQRNKRDPQTLESRFARIPIYWSDRELEAIAHGATATAHRAWNDRELERHPDSDRCAWRCPFTESCLLGRQTGWNKERDYMESLGFKQEFVRH